MSFPISENHPNLDNCFDLSFKDLQKLLDSKFYEHRLVALLILANKFQKAAPEDKNRKILKKYYQVMPRTILRYAIEKFEETKRKAYLHGKIVNLLFLTIL